MVKGERPDDGDACIQIWIAIFGIQINPNHALARASYVMMSGRTDRQSALTTCQWQGCPPTSKRTVTQPRHHFLHHAHGIHNVTPKDHEGWMLPENFLLRNHAAFFKRTLLSPLHTKNFPLPVLGMGRSNLRFGGLLGSK